MSEDGEILAILKLQIPFSEFSNQYLVFHFSLQIFSIGLLTGSNGLIMDSFDVMWNQALDMNQIYAILFGY